MSELNEGSKILLEVKSSFDPYGYIIPTYMRNVNTILQAKEKISKLSWDKEGEELVNDHKVSFTPEEKKIVKLLIMKGVPQEKRRLLWLISSGAKQEMQNNPKYYDFLVNHYPSDVELPNDRQIDLDIRRTFPEDFYFTNEKILKQLKNILLAYSRRNISIGYVQGFNFIVGRLLKVVKNEEEVFWIFTQIIENILPLNFYSEMAGLMIDVDILLCLIAKYFPDFIIFLEHNFFLDYFKNILLQWFVSLFIQNFSVEANLATWDVLFLDKNVVLFKTALAIVKYSQTEIMKTTSLESFKHCIKSTFENFSEPSFLLYYTVLKKFEFNAEILNKNRFVIEPSVVEHINSINRNKHLKLQEKINMIKEECLLEWPICVYDSESVYRVYDYYVYRQGNPPVIHEDYFSKKVKFSEKEIIKKEVNYATALIQRKVHLCNRRKKTEKSSGLCTVLDQINDLDDSLLNISTGTGDKSYDVSIDNKSTESYDKSSEKEDLMFSDKKSNPKFKDSLHEITKRSYKKYRKHTKMTSASYSQLIKKGKEDKDFVSFISKVNDKFNVLAGGKSFCLRNLENLNNTKVNLSKDDISFEI